MIIKYRVIKQMDTGQRLIVETFSSVQDAIDFHSELVNDKNSFYEIDVFYFK